MYRKGQEYDRLDEIVLDIYVDYGITTFPLDEKALCRMMGISLVPYSAFEKADVELHKKFSIYGYYSKGANGCMPTIFYNDNINDFETPATINQTIRHEIKHFVDVDEMDMPEDDDLAEHFGRYLACPTPYLVVNNITDVNVIISMFGVSATMAQNVSSAVINRINKFGYKLFEYEKRFVEMFNNKIRGDVN